MTVEVFVSIGSNIEPQENIHAALTRMEEIFGNLSISSVYETPAFGFNGPSFHNLVVAFETTQSASQIHLTLRQIEAEQNRQRSGESFDSRTLDLDLLIYGDQVINNEQFTVPHADILRYSFVLRPMLDLAPDYIHPVRKIPLQRLWSEMEAVDPGKLVDISDLYQTVTVNY